jgi:hypothetical protein
MGEKLGLYPPQDILRGIQIFFFSMTYKPFKKKGAAEEMFGVFYIQTSLA